VPKPPALSASARAIRESIFSRLAGRLAHHPDAVPLHLGDTWLPPPPGASVDARGLSRYGVPAGEPALLERLAHKLRTRNGLGFVEPHHLQVTVGATGALAAAARAVLDPGDEMIVPTPHWPLIRGIVTNAGGVPVEVPLSQKLYASASKSDASASNSDAVAQNAAALIEPAISPRTSALYLTSPNNPDGKVLSRAQLLGLAELAQRHDLWVLSDEVYEDLIYDGEHVSIASLPGMAERTISVFSLSKSFALAGHRLGYVAAAEAPMRALRKIVNHTVYNVPAALQETAARLYDDPATLEWLNDARAQYRRARDAASAALPLPHFLPDAATYLFVDLAPCCGDDLWPLVERLLDAGVSISPGEQFGRGFEKHARLCFTAVPTERVLVGIERIARLLG
jgi:aspartate/methionine/tyrosine aminotransferase